MNDKLKLEIYAKGHDTKEVMFRKFIEDRDNFDLCMLTLMDLAEECGEEPRFQHMFEAIEALREKYLEINNKDMNGMEIAFWDHWKFGI